jgi:NAD(P)-dependent dehydrogenase (short-subunit alcohol dehydrogenase family)
VLLDRATAVLDVPLENLEQTVRTNMFGPFHLCQVCIPLMRENGYGRIVNMSSTLGSLGVATLRGALIESFSAPTYRIAKTALNAVTVLFAREVRGTNIKVNSACPGWVRTEMAGSDAPLTIQQGADTPVWLATLPDNGPSGGFFRERKLVPW